MARDPSRAKSQLEWQPVRCVARQGKQENIPTARSGHTFSIIGSNGFLFGGLTGDEGEADQDPGPTAELYWLKIGIREMEWSRVKGRGVQPLPRWRHTASVTDQGTIAVLGGFHSSNLRLNDFWIFNTVTLSWEQPVQQFIPDPEQNAPLTAAQEAWSGAPSPRGGHSANVIENKLYVFGGYGGYGYARRDLDDLVVLDLEKLAWDRPAFRGRPPEKRSGHQAVVVEQALYLFGGWSATRQFRDLHVLDLSEEQPQWQNVEASLSLPRWHAAATSVMAIPSWKVFVFGGSAGELNERNRQGAYMDDTAVLDTGTGVWKYPEVVGKAPAARSDATLEYDTKGSRLLLFGGWANQWFGDVYTLDVGNVVGPPYAIMEVQPAMGAITGGTAVVITGIDFPTSDDVIIRFATKKFYMDVKGEFISQTELRCVTPDFSAFHACTVDVRVALDGDSFTTTSQKFQFFSVTHARKCLVYGPALLDGGAVKEETMFIIQARDAENLPRTTGGDEFAVAVRSVDVDEEGDPLTVQGVHVLDQGDGTYVVTFTVPEPGAYTLEAEFKGTFGGLAGHVRGSPCGVEFHDFVPHDNNTMSGKLVMDALRKDLDFVREFVGRAQDGILTKLYDRGGGEEEQMATLVKIKEQLTNVAERGEELRLAMDRSAAVMGYLKDQGINLGPLEALLKNSKKTWEKIQQEIPATQTRIAPLIKNQAVRIRTDLQAYETEVDAYIEGLKEGAWKGVQESPEVALELLAGARDHQEEENVRLKEMSQLAKLFDLTPEVVRSREKVEAAAQELEDYTATWQLAREAHELMEAARDILWRDVDPEGLEESARQLLAKARRLPKAVKESEAYAALGQGCKDFLNACPLVAALKQEAMRPRHWQQLFAATGAEGVAMPHENPKMRVRMILNLKLHEHQATVEEITDQAAKEAKLEENLAQLTSTWATVNFEMTPFKETDIPLLRLSEESAELLESDQLMLQGMVASRYTFFKEQSTEWQKALLAIADVSTLLSDLQRTWSYLEPLFIGSEEVKRELPDDTARFSEIDGQVRAILKSMGHMRNVKQACTQKSLLQRLESLQEVMEMCKKNLTEFLDQKRRQFPRFYFVSEADLLDVLSNSSNPAKVMKHIDKLLLATKELVLTEGGAIEGDAPRAVKFIAGVGKETVDFEPSVVLEGKVEAYLTRILDTQRATLMNHLKRSAKRYPAQPRIKWLLNKHQSLPTDPAQISLLVNGVMTVREIEQAMDRVGQGEVSALNSYQELHRTKLKDLIRLTQTELTPSDRQRIMCMITMDAHTRDLLERLLREKAYDKEDFQWKSQLKHRFKGDLAEEGSAGGGGDNDNDSLTEGGASLEEGTASVGGGDSVDGFEGGANIDICDASFRYGLEYLGNGPRLVITPLTDRIYVTATQALHLGMGCAPAGPAGTGKTETTKDLASALGKCCYVFNCSPEMDYQSLGNIFKGLASSGAWGCFDEFNRLVPEVLSVCSVQFKAVCDGVRLCTASGALNTEITIEGDDVELDPSCGAFITMNPGYLGRSELPEGLKALFRPITVMVPDLVLICENMLMAEGFVESRSLASKFFGLYNLLKELLSKQDHYDWGLRAVKSVLVVAGAMKRAEPELPEAALLLRALRDFNVAKIAGPDEIVFFGLLGDLFPGVEVPARAAADLERAARKACEDAELWPDPAFLKKIQQLDELLAIRHCVFVMGPPGAGKTSAWRTLRSARNQLDSSNKITVMDLNPKVVPTENLYGHISLATREWKDGLLSVLMRDLGAIPDELPKWLVLDGDLDANWIESMNSVMDDNRMLTLASNERIPLKPYMRMLFEIRDLRFATPATVSRAGILFLSGEGDAGWRALVASWVMARPEHVYSDLAREKLQAMFEEYVPPCLAFLSKEAADGPIVSVQPVTLVQNLLRLLEGVLRGDKVGSSSMTLNAMEQAFVFAAVWAFGAILQVSDDGTDYRKEFNTWWRGEFKTVRMPSRDTVFDYWLDPENLKFEAWKNSPVFTEVVFDSATMRMSEVTVPTTENCSVTHWVRLLLAAGRPAMLAGPAGTGKTQLVKGLLGHLDPEQFRHVNVNMNFYTTAAVLQDTMEGHLVKRSGATYGPAGMARMVFFVDDLNLPEVDTYDTQGSLALIRQHLDYSHWYDISKITLKTIVDCQYLAAMNPTAGSFQVNPRLQRHFATFVMNMPSATSLLTIYQTFLDGHFSSAGFNEMVKGTSSSLIKGALAIHKDCCDTFRKTATNFHYEFNIRHLANVFQGLLMAEAASFDYPDKFVYLWLHESQRVYGDRLVSEEDLEKFSAICESRARKSFPQFNVTRFFMSGGNVASDPLVFCHYPEGWEDEPVYDQVNTTAALREVLGAALADHNETNPAMDLVLFDAAALHVTRITRIIRQNAGHAMLVGVGGSGKQSLSRLAAHLCGYSLFQITVTQTYSMADLKVDLQGLYHKAGVKGEGVVFQLTDAHVTNEKFLVYINDLLSSGDIPGLYSKDEQDSICNQMFPKLKARGLPQDPSTCWNFFLSEVRERLHVVLCSSPMNPAFAVRARRFPALVSCVVYDWFQPWPIEALASVADKALAEIELLSDTETHILAAFMPESFEGVNKMCDTFKTDESRQVYTTPKSYLELLKVFKTLLRKERSNSEKQISRLENGLEKLRSSAESVGQLQETLESMLAEAERKREVAEGIAEKVAEDKAVVETETEKANVEAQKVEKIQAQCSDIAAEAEYELAKAEPAVVAAMAALDTLDKRDLGNCKTMARPPAGVEDIFAAVVVLLAGVNSNIPIQKSGKVRDKDRGWDAAKKSLLGNVNALIDELKTFKALIDEGQVPEINFKEVRPLLALPHFDVEEIEKKNSAVAGLCSWVINIVHYYDIILMVEPKRKALFKANAELEEANALLSAVQKRVAELQEKLDKLTAEFNEAEEQKTAAQKAAESGKLRLELAQRLINALGSENDRWAAGVETLREGREFIVGDSLLAAAFLSYVGPFTKPFRERLKAQWVEHVQHTNGVLKISPKADPLEVLTSEAEIARWQTQGLPADPVSSENGAIVQASARWPLLIDPQLQGVAWLKKREGTPERQLGVAQLGQPDLIKKLERAVEQGHSFLIENMGETIDSSLMPVISKTLLKKGAKTFIKIGGDEIEYNSSFRLYLHTKLFNPHYPPEIQAETTLVNFTVTPSGLEDQLLALVVRKERSDLASTKAALSQQRNQFTVKIKELEDEILGKLSDAEGDITEDKELIESLENAKKLSGEIQQKLAQGEATSLKINETAEKYRSVAKRGALLFFVMNDLYKIHTYYLYSLNAFVVMFLRGIELVQQKRDGGGKKKTGLSLMQRLQAAASKVVQAQRFSWNVDLLKDSFMASDADMQKLAGALLLRQGSQSSIQEPEKEEDPVEMLKHCTSLKKSITNVLYNYLRRGLFEKDKLTVAALLTFKIQVAEGRANSLFVQGLFQDKVADDVPPMGDDLAEWLQEPQWARLRRLEDDFGGGQGGTPLVPQFVELCEKFTADCDDWYEWYNNPAPETAPCPGDLGDVEGLPKLLLIRALRPDRVPTALMDHIKQALGDEFVHQPPFDMAACYQESSASTPIFFVLFPGVDPTPWVEDLGQRFEMAQDRGNFVNISMGQGQEKPAEAILDRMAEIGGWVLLQNVHLMQAWLPILDRKLEKLSETAHQNFRCFITAEPPPLAYLKNVPEGLLQACVKVANEAPADLRSNLRRAWAHFDQSRLDESSRPLEFRACLFGLCFFHAVVLGRRRFGPQGWSRPYGFNSGDLTICANILQTYLENSPGSVPWKDLRYIFGEIMYGGHITDFWDRRVNNAYLSAILNEGLVSSAQLAPNLFSPDPNGMDFSLYAQYIDRSLPPESPPLFGLHPNAEIGYLTAWGEGIFKTLLRLQGGGQGGVDAITGGPGGGGVTRVRHQLEELSAALPSSFNMNDLNAYSKEHLESEAGPYCVVALQECTRMNALLDEIGSSIAELKKGMNGQLNMSPRMEHLAEALSINQVPGRNPFHLSSWEKYAWPSRKSLQAWFQDMVKRTKQLEEWTANWKLPSSLWLPGLFNPTAMLTAVKQISARRESLPLDKMTIETHVTSFLSVEQAAAAKLVPEHGVLIHGLFMEGARWLSGEEAEDYTSLSDNVPCAGFVTNAILKDLLPQMPVMYIKAVAVLDEWEPSSVGFLRPDGEVYNCPVYATLTRGPTYVFLGTLRTSEPPAKWVVAGVALIMQTDN